MSFRHTRRPKGMPETIRTGLRFPESLRWHDGRLWLCNWLTTEVLAVDPADGRAEEAAVSPVPIPFCVDWLADGRLVLTAGGERRIVTQEGATYVDLARTIDRGAVNEVVADARGGAYVNGGGYDMMAGEEPAPGVVAYVTPEGTARAVADGIHFGNGMALTPDGATLIVAESHAARLTSFAVAPDGSLHERRVWADLGGGAAPDGIALDAEGAVWYADVPNERCVRVAAGGEVLEEVHADRGCFDCALGGEDGRTLFIAAAVWDGGAGVASPEPTGVLLAHEAPSAAAPRTAPRRP